MVILIDRVSLLIAPCGIGGGGYSDQKTPDDDNCAIREGVVISGIEWLSNRSPETWTAIASFAIAIFTWTLWRSSEKLWRAGERQNQTTRQIARVQAHQTRISNRHAAKAADAASRNAIAFMRAERAYLFIQINSESVAAITSQAGRWDKSTTMFGQETDTPSVGYSFKNFGRTAAILKELSNQLVFLENEFPTVADYTIRETMPEELIVEPGKTSAILGFLMNDTFTVGKAVKFQQRKGIFWFYGYVKFDDSFGREHEWRWRFRYRRGDGGFRLVYYREFPDETEG